MSYLYSGTAPKLRAEWRERVVTSNAGLRPGRQVKPMMGLRFGRLEVIAEDVVVYRMAQWRCRCSCGREVTVPGANLRRGKTQSCGCLRKEMLVKRWADAEKKERKPRAPRKDVVRKPVVMGRKRDREMEEEKDVRVEPVAMSVVGGGKIDVVAVSKSLARQKALALARSMRAGGARWAEVRDVTGLEKEDLV